jgi:hypothetical protein
MKWGAGALIIALLLPGFSLAQTVQVYDPEGPEAAAPKKAAAAAVEEDDPVAELERELAEQNKAMGAAAGMFETPAEKVQRLDDEARAKQDEAAESETEGMGLAINKDLLELQAAMQGGKSSLDILNDPVLRKKLIAAYQTNPMASLPKEVLRGVVEEQIQKTPLKGIVKMFPKLLDFLVNLLHHPKAMGQAVKVLDRTKDLKTCGYVSIGLMVFVFFLRRYLVTKRTRFFKRVLIGLSTSMLMLGGSLGFLWISFREELGPTLEVFRTTFL